MATAKTYNDKLLISSFDKCGCVVNQWHNCDREKDSWLRDVTCVCGKSITNITQSHITQSHRGVETNAIYIYIVYIYIYIYIYIYSIYIYIYIYIYIFIYIYIYNIIYKKFHNNGTNTIT